MDLNICTLVILKYHIFSAYPPYPYRLFPWARHATLGWGKIWRSSVFLAFEVYTPTLVWYQLDKRASGKRIGRQNSVCVGKCCALCHAPDQRWIKWIGDTANSVNKHQQVHEERCLEPVLIFGQQLSSNAWVHLANREQAKRRSRHEGTNTGASYSWNSKPNGGRATRA